MGKKRTPRRGVEAPAAAAPKAPYAPRFLSFLDRKAAVLALVLVAIASIRIVATYYVFSHTSDEPSHIGCGIEWLDKGRYTLEAQHPPLARVASAILPYVFLGARYVERPDAIMEREGLDVLYHEHRYDRNLAAARLGILPFFWIACFVVYAWAARDLGRAAAVLAVFLFSFLPALLAHAGLATTDMALTAFLGAAFLAGRIWIETPNLRTAAWLGVSLGLVTLSKFSCLVFLPAAGAAGLVCYLAIRPGRAGGVVREVRERIPTFAFACLLGCLTIWAGYRFSFGKVDFADLRLPAPELYRGINQVYRHNLKGHISYLLGRRNEGGFWYYYPIALAVKTPLAFLLLLGAAGAGIARSWRKDWRPVLPLAFAAAVLAVAMPSRINIGIRHILPVYMGFSLTVAYAMLRWIESPPRRWVYPALIVLLAWFGVSSVASHPDYLPYFNEIASSHPEKVLVDSDLDWGQDLKRLAARLQGVPVLTFAQYFNGYLQREQGLPELARMDLANPSTGWNAVELTIWKEERFGLKEEHPELVFWPDRIPPQEIVGKSIYLWYFPPGAGFPPPERAPQPQ
jgi:hypothetical protein